MGNKIERLSEIGNGSVKYLYFNRDNSEIWVGQDRDENHSSILISSRRPIHEISNAGAILKYGNMMIVNGDGSTGLKIPKKDPEEVILHLKNVSDASDFKVKKLFP